MREGWRQVRLGEITCQVKRERRVTRGSRYRLLGVRWYGQGPFHRETGVGGEIKASRLYEVQTGDLIYNRLFAWKGSFGVIGAEFDKSFVSGEFPVFQVDKSQTLVEFINLVMCRPSVWAVIERQSTGSTATSRNRWKEERFADWEVALPPLDEQRRIVDLIAVVDEAIEAAEEVTARADQSRWGLLGELLSEQRAMREGWRRTTLDEIAEVAIGRTPPRDKPEYWTDNLDRPFCTIADMTDVTVIPRREGVTTLAELEGKARRVPAGSLLMSFKLTLGRVGFAGIDLFPNEAIAWLRCTTRDVTERYLALWLSTLDMDEFAGRAVKGKTLNGPSLRALCVSFPPLDEQQRIVDLISAVNEDTSDTVSLATTLRTLRSAFLADLLSGDHEIPASYDELLSA
jgi:type I restriction enzyme S subunit